MSVQAVAATAAARTLAAHALAEVMKGWREQHPPTPHARFDVAVTDYWAPRIQRALGRLWTRDQLRAAIESASRIAPVRAKAASPDPVRSMVSSAASGSLRYTAADTAALEEALRGVWADSWITGAYVGAQQAGGTVPGQVGSIIAGVDWDTWQPGNVRAAVHTADGALRALLDRSGIAIRGLTETTLRQVGDKIAAGLLDGDSVDKIGRSLRDVLDGDAHRALMISHTETARAMTAASLDTYASNGIRAWDWLTTSGACRLCLSRESANPHQLAEPAPPGHPFCRCAPAPVVESHEAWQPF